MIARCSAMVLLLTGCLPDEPDRVEPPVELPALELEPQALDFGDQPLGTATAGRDVLIRNTGAANLDVYEVGLEDPTIGFTLGTLGQAFRIPPGSARSFVVRFEPTEPGLQQTLVTIVSNVDGRDAPATVPVEGVGVAASLSAPTSRTVTDAAIAEDVPIELRNVGDARLRIDSFELDGSPGFGLDLDEDRNGALPFELQPLDPETDRPVRTVFVTWDPALAEGADEATLSIGSNDWEHPVTTVQIRTEDRTE